jgi:hypothetical protein
MTNQVYDQLAHSGLLPDDVAAVILAGGVPPVEDLVLDLVIGALDAHAVMIGDPQSSPTERRIARLVLASAFLSALATMGEA